MEDLKVTANGYDFKPAQAAMQRYVDNNLLSGISWAVMVGRDLVDVNCVGWADKEAQTPLRTDHIFRDLFQHQADHLLRGAAAVRGRQTRARRPDRKVYSAARKSKGAAPGRNVA